MNEKLLKFDKMYSVLASNPFGKNTYIEQVKGKVDEGQNIEIKARSKELEDKIYENIL